MAIFLGGGAGIHWFKFLAAARKTTIESTVGATTLVAQGEGRFAAGTLGISKRKTTILAAAGWRAAPGVGAERLKGIYFCFSPSRL